MLTYFFLWLNSFIMLCESLEDLPGHLATLKVWDFSQDQMIVLTSQYCEWLLHPQNFLKCFPRWLCVWIFTHKAVLLIPDMILECPSHGSPSARPHVVCGLESLSAEGTVKLCSEPECSASAGHKGWEFLPSLSVGSLLFVWVVSPFSTLKLKQHLLQRNSSGPLFCLNQRFYKFAAF